MSIYQFKEEDAFRFASEQGIEARRIGSQLRFRQCPYCKNNNPSFDKDTFAISLETGQFNCLRASCGAKGNMLTLASDFDFSLGRDVDEYYRPKRRYRDLRKYPRPSASTSAAIAYLEERGISRKTTEAFAITTHREDDRRLCFPFFDEDGNLQLVKYRNMDFKKGGSGNKEWSMSGCKPVLFGMDKRDPTASQILVITEGQIDSLSVYEAYDGEVNAVSVPNGAKGFTWIPYCWDFLGKFSKLVVFGDYENGNISLLEEMKQRFHGLVYHVREEDYKDCKDANEVLVKYGKEAVRDAVENAVLAGSSEITRLADVERKDVSRMPRVKTGIPTLDRTTGGLFLGSLVVLTGERGKGKSTLGSQIATRAIEQGFNTFIYSGELMGWMVQDWIDRQIAGSGNINARKSGGDGFTYYSLSPETAEAIHDWYRDACYIYDVDQAIQEDEAETDIALVLEKAIKMYGCQVLIVDNLMTAMTDDLGSDLYRQQSNFVKQLSKIAKQYDVLVILIAHPRKSISDRFRNDDVLGSSNITNLADIILYYDAPKEDKANTEPAPRVLAVTKNRMTGKVHKGIDLWFDEASKRISEVKDDFGWDLGWGNGGWQHVEEDDMEVIPF